MDSEKNSSIVICQLVVTDRRETRQQWGGMANAEIVKIYRSDDSLEYKLMNVFAHCLILGIDAQT